MAMFGENSEPPFASVLYASASCNGVAVTVACPIASCTLSPVYQSPYGKAVGF